MAFESKNTTEENINFDNRIDVELTTINEDSIPLELKDRIQWILFKSEMVDGKLRKYPFNVRNQMRWKSSEDQSSFELVHRTFINNHYYSGICFVMTENDPYICIDFDHVYDPITKKWTQQAWEEIKKLDSYTEFSPSKTGVHVFVKGKMVKAGRRKEQTDGTGREMYSDLHYMTVTGNHIPNTPLEINEAQEAIDELYDKWFSNDNLNIFSEAPLQVNESSYARTTYLENLPFTDNQIIENCENAANGAKFKDLFNGNWIGKYGSQSEADLALCSIIAFNTNNFGQIDSIFRISGLYRDKWDANNGIYRDMTIAKALESVGNTKADYTRKEFESSVNIESRSEGSKQEIVLKEPYIVTEKKIYLNVMDRQGNHLFAYLGNSNQVEYVPCVTDEGKVTYPQELPRSRMGKIVNTVGIPLKELIDSSQTMNAKELYELIITHITKYVDAPQIDIEMFAYYILFTWFYKKNNTTPYLRFIADTGKGKSRMLSVVGDLCFYPVTVSGGSSISGIMRFNELWHGTLKIDEADTTGGMESDFAKYLNLGFEKDKFFAKTDSKDYAKQEFFDPFGPKVIAMRMPFRDNATEARLLSFSPRETTNPDIPIILPPAYIEEVEQLRALIARFVLFNWTKLDVNRKLSCKGMNIEPRLQQLAIPLSIVLQLLPDGEERFKDYISRRQGEVTKARSESWEGMIFNYIYALAIGDEKPIDRFEEYFVEGNIVAITASMVSQNFSTTTRSITQALSSIGIISESKTVMVLNDGNLKSKKTRMYVVPTGAAWREIIQRYLDKDPEEMVDSIPKCPDVLKAKGYIE